jgi:hypothetical protein
MREYTPRCQAGQIHTFSPHLYPCREPIFKRSRDLAEIFLRERLLIPHDELDASDIVRERKVYQKVKSSIFRGVNGV